LRGSAGPRACSPLAGIRPASAFGGAFLRRHGLPRAAARATVLWAGHAAIAQGDELGLGTDLDSSYDIT